MGIILFERETCDLKARLEEYLYKFINKEMYNHHVPLYLILDLAHISNCTPMTYDHYNATPRRFQPPTQPCHISERKKQYTC